LQSIIQKEINVIEGVEGAASELVALTPEGIPVSIGTSENTLKKSAQNLFDFMGNANNKKSSINSIKKIDLKEIPDFIKLNRVPSDKETILSNKAFERTNKIYQNARIYKKDDKYYYRDQMHTGRSAHLEVFDKRGSHLGEADPLTGELIVGTADPTKKIDI
jgi:hypothetical protein